MRSIGTNGEIVSSNNNSDETAKVIAGVIVFVVLLIAFVPKPVWIALGVVAAIAILIGITIWAMSEKQRRRAAAEERAHAAQEERARREKQARIETLGQKNAELVESALAAIGQIVASEASSAGWLGDVDFTVDINAITDSLRKAHELNEVAEKLSVLSNPSDHDRIILEEARSAEEKLEHAAYERVWMIKKCAAEATLVDESLRREREEAKDAEQRAELNAKLSAMLYGIEATPDTTPPESAADGVMARVLAYREIKKSIQHLRNGG